VYIIAAFLELISYYFTGFKNNGRFPIVFTLLKKLLLAIFYLTIGIILVLYFGMACFVLVWMILAAVLNPSKNLPYATATLAFFTVIGVKIVTYKLKYKSIYNRFDGAIKARFSQA
jgi:hypothetical protein